MLCTVLFRYEIRQALAKLLLKTRELFLRVKFVIIAVEIKRSRVERFVDRVCFEIARYAAAYTDDGARNIRMRERETKIEGAGLGESVEVNPRRIDQSIAGKLF